MQVQYLERSGKPELAYIHTPAGAARKYPAVMFMGGYRSDMTGTKATYLEGVCKARGQGYLRFDYSGHGASGGRFEEGTVGSWREDALDILEHVFGSQPVVLVGSSMGGWIALLCALARAGQVRGLIGIAAAPDFTEDLYRNRLDDDQRKVLMDTGKVEIPNDYSDEPYHFTRAIYEEAKKHLLLNRKQAVDFSIRLIQGLQDKDVPWETAVRIQNAFEPPDMDIVFVEDGDHSLSRPEDLELIDREIKALCGIL